MNIEHKSSRIWQQLNDELAFEKAAIPCYAGWPVLPGTGLKPINSLLTV
jgi:hypothetical protein